MNALENKVAVVTGAASGIGLAMAKRFAAEGMKVVLADIEDAALQHAAEALRSAGADVVAVRTDVSKLADVQALAAKTIDRFGKAHVVCNNAGVVTSGLITDSTAKDWEWVVGVNLWGVIYGVQTFLPILLEQGEECHIVNTGSIAGLMTGPGMGIYCTTKHAVVGLSEALHHEMQLMQTNVGVSVLCPGWVRTKIVDAIRNRPAEFANEGSKLSPLAQSLHDYTLQVVEDGLDPDIVADRVVDAVKERKLYIFTHPELMPAVKARMEGILSASTQQFVPRQ